MIYTRQELLVQNPWSQKYRDIQNLEELKKIALTCNQCHLREGCTQVVFGAGNPNADLMLIGEGPGREEDLQGEPFVGKAGQLLNKILAAVGISRETIYISNVIKCRPRGNRTPELDEMRRCIPFLAREIELVNPVLICLMGSVALKGVLDPNGYITKMRGKWIERGGKYFLPTFHPAALLRDVNKKLPAWNDFKKIKKAYERYKELKARGDWPPK